MEELDALAMQAGQVDAELGEQTPEAMAANAEAAVQLGLGETNANGVRMLFAMAGPVFGLVGFPSVAPALTAEKTEAFAIALGAVLAKYNVDLSNMGAQYREEIACAFAGLPVAMAVWNGIKYDAEQRAAAAKPALVDGRAGVSAVSPGGLKPGDLGYREPAPVAAAA